MPRLLLTFQTLHRVMSAEKFLRFERGFNCRVTPLPAGVGDSVCGMAVELLHDADKTDALTALQAFDLPPKSVHELP